MNYKNYIGEMDSLTGCLGRKRFLSHCDRLQRINRKGLSSAGWFMFIDADYFKKINDSLGHATGDMVLKKIAASLQRVLGKDGVVGRIGGDEFAAIIEKVP